MSDPRHSVSVAGIITDGDGRTLLIKRRDNGHWEPPGGRLELEESITCGLQREIQEETGLTVEPVALTGVYKNMPRGIVALVFRCQATGGQLNRNGEATNFHWAARAELADFLTEAYAVRINDALNRDHAPAIREHDGTKLL